MLKISPKHRKIFKTILEKGKYKPTYSDQEPATQTLIKAGMIEWNVAYTGLILTPDGKSFANKILNQ